MARMIVTVKKLNRRSGPIANVADKTNVIDVVLKGFAFDSVDVARNAAGTWYKDNLQQYYWGGGLMIDASTIKIVHQAQPVIAEEQLAQQDIVIETKPLTQSTGNKKSLLNQPVNIPAEMPLTQASCIKCATWMKENFGEKIDTAVKDSPFDSDIVYAITCQETAQRWMLWIKDFDAKTILQRSVFDASGDIAGTNRSAFPKNKAEMVARFGNSLTKMLIDEANKMRSMPQPGQPGGYHAADYLYKGYGIFQYDLQHILTDKDFFENKLWYSIDDCIERLLKELNTKWNINNNDMYATIRSYNGSGVRAEQYAQKVSQFYNWIKTI